MAAQDGEVRATFLVIPGTDIRKFQAVVRAVYRGKAEGDKVAYLLDHTKDVVCGHDPKVSKRSGGIRHK